jgi:ubiquitin carboxyl-terminal hydrolase 34
MAGHDAMQVNTTGQQLRSPKAPSSEPSLPRRDSVDGDDTLTRKRPRLDSGSRSKSADRVLSASNQTVQPQDRSFLAEEDQEIGENQAASSKMVRAQQTPNKVTINIRNPQQAVNGDALSDMSVDMVDRRDSHVSPTPLPLSKDGLDSGTQEDQILRNGASSPVLISSSPEIEIEIGEPEDLEEEPAAVDIRLDGMEGDLVFMMLNKFPYASSGDWISGAKLYLDHVDSGKNLCIYDEVMLC